MGNAVVAGVVVVSLWIAAAARAASWTSPDGQLTFDLPADGSLVAVKSPPAPAVAIWSTADGQAKLAVIAMPAPPGSRLDKAGLEEGTVGQLPGGTLLSSTEQTINGSTLYTIAAANARRTQFIQQSVIVIGNVGYKLMAAGTTPIAQHPQLAPLFQSIRPTRAATPAAPAPSAAPPGHLDAHNLSVNIGEFAFALIAVGVIVAVVRRKSGVPAATPGPPPPSSPAQAGGTQADQRQ